MLSSDFIWNIKYFTLGWCNKDEDICWIEAPQGVLSFRPLDLPSGRKQAASVVRAKEAIKAQAVDGEGQERRLGCGQAAARGQEKIDGSEARGVGATELRHRKRRQHRNLRPRGPDPALRSDQRPSWRNSSRPFRNLIDTNTNWSGESPTDAQRPTPHRSTADDRSVEITGQHTQIFSRLPWDSIILRDVWHYCYYHYYYYYWDYNNYLLKYAIQDCLKCAWTWTSCTWVEESWMFILVKHLSLMSLLASWLPGLWTELPFTHSGHICRCTCCPRSLPVLCSYSTATRARCVC